MLCKLLRIMLATIFLIGLFPTCTLADNTNLITDGGFETDTGVITDNTYTFISSDEARTGSRSLKLQVNSDVARSIKQNYYLTELIHGAEYTLSLWYKGSMQNGNGLGAGFYCYGDTSYSIEAEKQFFHTKAFAPTSVWTELNYTFECSEDVNAIRMYLDFTASKGEIYIDDLSLSVSKVPDKFTINTDNVFYYSDWDTGVAEVTLDPYYEQQAYRAVFNIMDGETSLASYETTSANRTATYEFDISLLAEKKKQYFVTADIYNTDDELIDTVSEEIYRYDRPTQMNENGEFIEKGEVFRPVLGYRISSAKYEVCAQAGFNVAVWQFNESIDVSLRQLDEMYAQGYMAAVVCYWSMYPAGNPRNIERVAPYIEAVKKHPAIFCWMVMDEPYYNDPINATNDLRASYKMIRGIDDEHPVYIIESVHSKYKDSGKYSDYLAIDPYPGNGLDYGTHVGNTTILARNAVNNKKPVLHVLQSFTFGLTKPTTTELHSMIYQAFLGGAQGIGYFWFINDSTPADAIFPDTEYDAVLSDFYKYESDIMFGHFSSGKSPYFNKVQNNDLWYEIWEDGDNMYAAVQNRLNLQNKVNIPLVNKDEDTKITGFDIEPISTAPITVKAHSGSFTLNLAPHQAVLLKLSAITKDAYQKEPPLPPIILNGDFENGTQGWTAQNATTADGCATLSEGSLSQSFGINTDSAAYKIEFDYKGNGIFKTTHNLKEHFVISLPAAEEWTYCSRILRLENNASGDAFISFSGNLIIDNVKVTRLDGYDFDNLIPDPGFEYYADRDEAVSDITIHPDGILPWNKKSYIVSGGEYPHTIPVLSGNKLWYIPTVSGGALSIRIDSEQKPNTNAYKDTGLTLSFDLYRTASLPFGVWIELVSPNGSDAAGQYNGANGGNSSTAIYHTDYHPLDAPTPGEWTKMTFDLSEILKGRTPDLYDSAYQMNLIFMTGHTTLYIDNISLTQNNTHISFVNTDGQVLSSLSDTPCDVIVKARYFSDGQSPARLIIASYLPDANGNEQLCDIRVHDISHKEYAEAVLEDESNHGGKIIKAFLWADGVEPLIFKSLN